ncbi:hypothetical protein F2Q69_00044646 [Brassica cretica]|uniref:Uncharacterized protein n=1 Tax=Brassica cretica TaxID=69181 RepID=A0A8S9NGL3_BRACR|nr:hypothetical protein F2Q69_00044646 [Brassica cretica]
MINTRINAAFTPHQTVDTVSLCARAFNPRPSVVELHQSPRGHAVSSSPSGLSLTVETPHRKDLMYKSSPPRRDRISRPWYLPPPSCSSSSRNGEVEKQQWWIWDVLHIWSLFFWILTN